MAPLRVMELLPAKPAAALLAIVIALATVRPPAFVAKIAAFDIAMVPAKDGVAPGIPRKPPLMVRVPVKLLPVGRIQVPPPDFVTDKTAPESTNGLMRVLASVFKPVSVKVRAAPVMPPKSASTSGPEPEESMVVLALIAMRRAAVSPSPTYTKLDPLSVSIPEPSPNALEVVDPPPMEGTMTVPAESVVFPE